MGAPFTQIVGNPPLFYTYAWKNWYDTLLAARKTYCQGNRPVTYYFDTAGSDSNNGTNPNTPFQSVSKAQDILNMSNGNIQLLFKRGCEFLASSGLALTKTFLKVADYGDPNAPKPMISAFTTIWASGSNNWKFVSGTTSSYSGLIPNIGYLRFNGTDAVRLNPIIYGFATPYTNANAYTWCKSGPHTIINLGSGVNANDYAFEFRPDVQSDGIGVTGDGCWVKNMRCDGWGCVADQQYQNYGISMTPLVNDTILVEACEAYYQGRHGISQHSIDNTSSGGIVTVVDCLNGMPNNTANAGVNLYNSFQSKGGHESIFHNCTVTHGSLPQSGVGLNDGSDSFYGHTNVGTANLAIVWGGRNLRASGRATTAAGTAYYAEFPLSVLRMLPRTELVSRLHEKVLEKGRDRETVILVLSCRSGGRSCQAQTLLADAGIVTESLDGGVLGWQEEKENETAH